MIPQLSDELLGRLSAFATEQFGLRFPPDRWNELARGVASAALELGISDLEGWAEKLVSGMRVTEQLNAVANHLTISETYFFRQQEGFALLENEILPARIAARRQQSRALRIWSAGCASGEEPYSIAILLRKRFPEVRPDAVVISGTDINSHVLARAARGIYSEWSFRDAPDWLKRDFFQQRSAHKYEIVPEIRALVHFQQLNLAAPLFPAEFGERADFDAILCRNVLMYFSAEWQDRIIRRFVSALVPGGWLLVGPCDVTSEEADELHLQSVRPGFFQKATAEARKAPSATPLQMRPEGLDVPLPTMPPVAAAATEPTPAAPPPPAGAADVGRGLRPPPITPVPQAWYGDPALHYGAAPAAPDAAGAAEAVARSHADRGELDEALAACNTALAADNLNAGLHYLRACVLVELGRFADAEAGFRRVLYLEPNSIMAHFALGALAQRTGNAAEARRHFTVLLSVLAPHPRSEAVPQGDGMTIGRLREVVQDSLSRTEANA